MGAGFYGARTPALFGAPLNSQKRKSAVILGAQWGDEGKGKIVDVLSEKFDIAGNDVELFRQDVDDLTLTLIAPLGAKDDGGLTFLRIQGCSEKGGSARAIKARAHDSFYTEPSR